MHWHVLRTRLRNPRTRCQSHEPHAIDRSQPLHQRDSSDGDDPAREQVVSQDHGSFAPQGRGGRPTAVRLRDRSDVPVTEQGNDSALAFMAHELRTPLSAIIGMADLLRDSQLSDDQRDMLDVMGRSARALVEIVNGVLDLEKLEAGKLQLERRTFSPADCVEECINLLAASAAQKRIDLAFFIDDSVPSLIKGDAVRLRQTLINLLGNALKFTDEGQVVVTVTCTSRTDDRCELRFSVADSGPGIPAERLGAIFEPYAQAEASTSRRFGGTGLGLPITKRLVALMGGRLWVESEIAEGSTFHFTLPAALDLRSGVRAQRRAVGLAGKRILVVEDNPVVGDLLVAALEGSEMEGALAPDLARAVTALQSGEFDLALIDGELPGTSGRAVAHALRGLPGQSALPLVLMTNLGVRPAPGELTTDRHDGRFAAYVTKPVRPARLRDALVQAFTTGPSDPGRGRPATSSPHATPAATPAATPTAAPTPTPTAAPTATPTATEPHGAVTASADAPVDRSTERSADRGTPSARGPEQGLSGIRVLVADDDAGVRAVLARSLTGAGAEVRTVEDGLLALSAARTWDADTILLDASMPGLDGFEVCRRLKSDPVTRLVPVIIITGLDTSDDRRRVLDAGADGIIPKPFDRQELLARVRSSARMKQATDGLERADEVLVVMARSIEGSDPNTLGHCERISDYCARLAARLGMDEDEIAALRLSGLVHDIGKVALPDAILRKSTPLDEQEWVAMRSHPVEGERLCSGASKFRGALPVIRHHHEKLDGTGYPDGLTGFDIPVAARVLQVVDVYDALTTARPYRRAESPEGALGIIEHEVERGWWDPSIFSAFRDLVREDLHARRGNRSFRH